MFALFEKEKNRIGKVDVTLCCYGEDRAVFPVEYSVCRRGAVVRAEGRGQQIRDTLTLTRRGAGYVATRRFQNIGKEPIRLKELCLTANGLDFGGAAEDDYFYSDENPRIYGTFPYLWITTGPRPPVRIRSGRILAGRIRKRSAAGSARPHTSHFRPCL